MKGRPRCLICKTLCETPGIKERKKKKLKFQVGYIFGPVFSENHFAGKGAAPDGRLPDMYDFYLFRIESRDKRLLRRACGLIHMRSICC